MAQRPLTVNLDVLGPFNVVKRPLTLALMTASTQEKRDPAIWWKLDEAQGSEVKNAAGSAFNGKIHGEPHWTSSGGVIAGALQLDGNKNWVEAADSSLLEFQGGLTAAAWFKVAKSQGPGTLLAKGEVWRLQRQGEKGGLEFLMHGPMSPKAGATSAKSVHLKSKRVLDDGQWHHVAVTYDGTRAALYLDGIEEVSVPATGMISANNIPVTAGENYVLRSRCFDGLIDDARVYQRGLSAEDIKALGAKAKGIAKQ